uniref:DDE Tnp4 domain-containing protein n=1 Tax=Ditylenchus dipsaci TaxID=166011 RepID=A0A915DU31_9BILA
MQRSICGDYTHDASRISSISYSRHLAENAERFLERRQFPKTLGAIDGKHIALVQPDHAGALFYKYRFGLEIYSLWTLEHQAEQRCKLMADFSNSRIP